MDAKTNENCRALAFLAYHDLESAHELVLSIIKASEGEDMHPHLWVWEKFADDLKRDKEWLVKRSKEFESNGR